MFKKIPLKKKFLFFLLSIYTIIHIFFANTFITPLFWLSFLIIFYYPAFNLPKRKELNFTLTIALSFFILYLVGGIAFGFNKDYFDAPLINIFLNLGNAILLIFGMEMLRFKLIKNNKNNFLVIALITLLMIISELNFKNLFLAPKLILFHLFISLIIPLIAQNILYTYLSLKTHYDIPIIIRLFDEVPNMLIPIMLNRNWFITGSFALIKVLIIYYLFKTFIFKTKTNNHHFKLNKILYPLTIISSIFLILFMLGLFPYQPIAILSNSMNPTFKRGDIVIYKKQEDIKPGDIIVFQYQNENIVHRVVSINEYFVTKGDANNDIDYIKVKKEDIKGVYQFSLQYLGYPSIWLNELFTKEN